MMHRLFTSLAALALIAGPMTSGEVMAQARSLQPQGEQDSAREQMQAGRNMSIRDIERRIIPQMESTDEYIGFEYDPAAQAYRLKFIRDGRVIWVDVDARTARVLRVSR
jgi:Ni/Co efflux regulator RcnB